jgi:hypothetical protein
MVTPQYLDLLHLLVAVAVVEVVVAEMAVRGAAADQMHQVRAALVICR